MLGPRVGSSASVISIHHLTHCIHTYLLIYNLQLTLLHVLNKLENPEEIHNTWVEQR